MWWQIDLQSSSAKGLSFSVSEVPVCRIEAWKKLDGGTKDTPEEAAEWAKEIMSSSRLMLARI